MTVGKFDAPRPQPAPRPLPVGSDRLSLAVTDPAYPEVILRNAATEYRQMAAKLTAGMPDVPELGKVWLDLAHCVERAATCCENARKRRGL